LILTTPFLSLTQTKESSFGVYYGLNEYFQGTPIVRQYQNNGDQTLTRLQSNFGLTYHRFNAHNFVSCDLNFLQQVIGGLVKLKISQY
jgi:hypothetical protein